MPHKDGLSKATYCRVEKIPQINTLFGFGRRDIHSVFMTGRQLCAIELT